MATKSIAWNDGSGDHLLLTYQGKGNGNVVVQTGENKGSSRSQVITVETVGGAVTKNFTVTQAASPFPVGNVQNFLYTGNYQEIELPAGQYKLQCWGAQGGSNAAASSYGITAKAGGKGGYSEGVITLLQRTTLRVYVGGQGSSSAGGFNGGGSTTGSSTYNSGDTQGVSRMGGGGGASDIRLSDGALLSRMIVAGGGSGGAMCYKKVTTTSTQTVQDIRSTSFQLEYWANHYVIKGLPITAGTKYTIHNNGSTKGTQTTYNYESGGYLGDGSKYADNTYIRSTDYTPCSAGDTVEWTYSAGETLAWIDLIFYDSSKNVLDGYGMRDASGTRTITAPANTAYIRASFFANYVNIAKIKINGTTVWTPTSTTQQYKLYIYHYYTANYHAGYDSSDRIGSTQTSMTSTAPSGANYMDVYIYRDTGSASKSIASEIADLDITVTHTETTTSVTESNESQVGYAGGGTNGVGYSSTYQGKQNAAGSGGSFGQGANQTTTGYRYCSGAGGGGWYGGGGGQKSDSTMTYCKYSGGGSGFVNTAASAGNRPSGYTGLELDSGTTYDGNTSFHAPGGGNETGHSGDGYVRITRLS